MKRTTKLQQSKETVQGVRAVLHLQEAAIREPKYVVVDKAKCFLE